MYREDERDNQLTGEAVPGRTVFYRGKGLELDGSFTVEASFVVPIIIFGIVALVWVVFYLTNSVKIMADADYFVFNLEAEAARNRNAGTYAGRINGEVPKGFYGVKSAGGYVRRDGRDLLVSLELAHNLPADGLLGYFVSGVREIKLVKEERVPNPSEISRIIKAAGELVGRIKP